MPEQAGYFSFFRTLLVLVLIYYGLRFLMRILIPMFFRSSSGKKGKNRGQSSKQKKKNDSELGEYVDFEEIE